MLFHVFLSSFFFLSLFITKAGYRYYDQPASPFLFFVFAENLPRLNFFKKWLCAKRRGYGRYLRSAFAKTPFVKCHVDGRRESGRWGIEGRRYLRVGVVLAFCLTVYALHLTFFFLLCCRLFYGEFLVDAPYNGG